MRPQRVKLTVENSELLVLLERVTERFLKVRNRPLNRLDLPDQIVAVNFDNGSARANELRVCFQPTDGFRSFAAAVLAGDVN